MLNAMEDLKYGALGDIESDEKFRVLFEMSPLPIFLETLQWKIIGCNSAAVKMTGYSAKELLEMTAADLVPGKVAKNFPKLVAAAMKKGIFRVQAENRRKNGEVFPVDVTGRVITIGGRKHVFVTVIDITDQQTELNKIKESEEGFRLLFNGISDGVLVANAKTKKFFLSNPAMENMLGMNQKQIMKLGVKDLHPESEAGHAERMFEAMNKGKINLANDVLFKRKDGTLFYADVRSYPFSLKGVQYTVGLFRDVTERKKSAEALELENKKISILHQIVTVANQAESLPRLMKSSLLPVLKTLGFEGGGVYLVDKEKNQAEVVESYNLQKKFLQAVKSVDITKKPYSTIFIKGEPIITENFDKLLPIGGKVSDFKSLISVPLIAGGQIIGALNIASKKRSVIPDDIKEILVLVGKELGNAVKRVQTEERLKRHDERYRIIIEHSLDIIFTFDRKGKIIFITPNVSRVGHNVKDVIGRSFKEFVHPEDAPRLAKELRRVIRTKKVFFTTFRLLKKDGGHIYVEEYGTPVFDASGKFTLFTGAMRDVSERMQAQEKLRESEEKYRKVIETADELIIVAQDGMLKFFNPKVVDFLEYSEKELLAKPFVGFIHPEDKKIVAERYVKRIRGDKDLPEIYSFRVVDKSGKVKWVEIHAAVIDWQGKPATLNFLQDITSRKRAEEELGKHMVELETTKATLTEALNEVRKEKYLSENLTKDLEKFKMAVEGASDHVIITGLDAKIIFANKAAEKTTGYRVEEMIGEDPGDLWGGQMSRDFFRKMWHTIKDEKKVYRGELTNKRKNGELYNAELHISPILNKAGDVLFFVGIERDITQAKEVDRMKSEFVTIASHQLRTPLTGTKWYAELLLAGKEGLTKKQLDFVRKIYDSNQKMIRLVNDLLNVSRIETSRKYVIEKKRTDMLALLRRAIADQGATVAQNNIGIITPGWPKKLIMSVDDEKMYQVFQNLIHNAVSYSERGEKVDVGIVQQKGKVIFTVKDRGIGIPTKQHGRVFEKFFRGDNVAESGKAGTGLGLYIAKAIAEGHGGRIWFESAENKGTTFYIELPKNN